MCDGISVHQILTKEGWPIQYYTGFKDYISDLCLLFSRERFGMAGA